MRNTCQLFLGAGEFLSFLLTACFLHMCQRLFVASEAAAAVARSDRAWNDSHNRDVGWYKRAGVKVSEVQEKHLPKLAAPRQTHAAA